MQTPAAFEYERATSLEGAIASLQRLGPEARVIAGGHSLLPMMKLRLANPEHLIDINDLSGARVHPRGGRRDQDRRADAARRSPQVRGAGASTIPLFRDAEHVIADPVVRNRGTIGGSLCQADPAEDLSAVCSAAKAEGRDPRRRGRARRRHGGLPRRPVHDGGGSGRDPHRDPARPCAPARAAHTRRWSAAPATGRSPPPRRRSGCDGGTIADAGIALSAVGLTTIHLTRAEELLRGKAPSDELFEQAGEIASEDCSPGADGRGPIDYKRHLAGVLTQRALRRATARALHEEA